MTQRELGEASGMSQAAVASYEGRQRKQSRRIMDLARALEVNPEWLETGKGSMAPATPGYGPAAPPKQHRLMEGRASTAGDGDWPFASISRSEYESLTEDQRRTVENVARIMVDDYAIAARSRTKPPPKNKPRRG